jgi:hypothetical protein
LVNFQGKWVGAEASIIFTSEGRLRAPPFFIVNFHAFLWDFVRLQLCRSSVYINGARLQETENKMLTHSHCIVAPIDFAQMDTRLKRMSVWVELDAELAKRRARYSVPARMAKEESN